jgi:hypothetical protein
VQAAPADILRRLLSLDESRRLPFLSIHKTGTSAHGETRPLRHAALNVGFEQDRTFALTALMGRFLTVTSTGRRNTGLKSFCRRLVAERHARAFVEFPCDVV